MNYKNIIKGFDIVKSADIFNDVIKYAKQGALRGVYLGFPSVHKYYSMSLPGVTDWTGFPRSGKTQVLMEFLLNTSDFYGWKHLIYFPDVGSAVEIIADLIHKRTGKTFDKRYKNHITEMEINIEITWVLEHFKILTKNDLKAKLSPYQFWDLAAKMNGETKGGVQTASIDAWKDMKHDTKGFGRDDKYLEDVLSYRNSMSEKHKMHFHTIIHPTRTDKDKDGNRKPPTPYDLKGGTEWFNNGKNMVSVHREDGDTNEVKLYWTKIKPRSIGETGVSHLNFDLDKFRYFEDDMGTRLFAKNNFVKTQKASVSEIIMPKIEGDDQIPF